MVRRSLTPSRSRLQKRVVVVAGSGLGTDAMFDLFGRRGQIWVVGVLASLWGLFLLWVFWFLFGVCFLLRCGSFFLS